MSLSILTKRLPFNFAAGRNGTYPVDMIVVHVTEGDAASVIGWFNTPKGPTHPNPVSAHYLVMKNGKIIQFVDEEDTAWHAGRVQAPTASLVLERSGVNPNSYSIGIEHEGDGTHELTDAQRAASVALIADICQRRHIPVDREHIVGHHEIFSGKTCPGKISVTRLVAGVKEAIAPTKPIATADYPRVVWSPHSNDYLVVTQYVSDDEWYFRTASELALVKGIRAATPLSQMPQERPR